MTAFIVVCAAMIAAALLWILIPLWRARSPEATDKRERRTSTVIVSLAIPALAVGLYATLSNWSWDEAERARAQANQVDDALQQLAFRLEQNPNDVDGWLLLGRSYTATGRAAQAVAAFERAYALTQGENVEATVGLGEALFMNDQSTLAGRAGQLFEAV